MSKETKQQKAVRLEEKATEIAVRDIGSTTTAVADIRAQAAMQAQQMQEAGIEMKDLEIPKLMLMQATSEAVANDRAEVGDILNTMDESVVGSLEQKVEIIPLKQFKTVRIYDMSSGDPEFIRAEQDDGKNSSFEMREGREKLADGTEVPVKRVLNMNFFVLLKKEVDEDEAFPAVISFKSTSIPAGKQVATQMFKMLQLGKLPYSKSVILGVKKDSKDKRTWAVYTVEKGNQLDEKAMACAAKWLASLAAANVKIQEDAEEGDFEENTSTGPVAAPTVVGGSEVGPY